MQELLDKESVARGLRRIAGEILEKNRGTQNLLLVGVRRGGLPVMREVARWIKELEGTEVRTGSVDITLYRDDAATTLPSPRIGPSEMPHSIDGLRVVLIDDVAYTRRTTRAALEAVLDYGRPSAIELCVVVDREGGELPIQPDYWVKKVTGIGATERVDVVPSGDGLVVVVQPFGSPTLPPNALEVS